MNIDLRKLIVNACVDLAVGCSASPAFYAGARRVLNVLYPQFEKELRTFRVTRVQFCGEGNRSIVEIEAEFFYSTVLGHETITKTLKIPGHVVDAEDPWYEAVLYMGRGESLNGFTSAENPKGPEVPVQAVFSFDWVQAEHERY